MADKSNRQDSSAIPPAIADLIATFEQHLGDVRFPGVDAGTLAGLADQVRASAAEVEAVCAKLEACRTALAEAQEELRSRGEQALAYARIYAAGNPSLLARLAAISVGRAPKQGSKPKPKVKTASEGKAAKKRKKEDTSEATAVETSLASDDEATLAAN